MSTEVIAHANACQDAARAAVEALVAEHGLFAWRALQHGMHLLGAKPILYLDTDQIFEDISEALNTGDVEDILDLQPYDEPKIDPITWAWHVTDLHNNRPSRAWWVPLLDGRDIDLPDNVYDTVRDEQRELLLDAVKLRIEDGATASE